MPTEKPGSRSGFERQLEAKLSDLRHELERRQQAWETETRIAARVHESLLPRPVRRAQIEVDTRYVPVERVGGDYCQVLFPDDSCCYITLCDVAGHGIGPALLATRVSSEVRHLALDGLRPVEIVRCLNAFVLEHFGDTNLQLSFFAARFDLAQGLVTYSGAGHPGPLLIRKGQITVLESQNLLVGVEEHCLNDRPEDTQTVHRGDRVLFFTDGLSEARGSEGEMLGADGIARIASTACTGSVFDMAGCILERVEAFRNGPPQDDITLIIAELK